MANDETILANVTDTATLSRLESLASAAGHASLRSAANDNSLWGKTVAQAEEWLRGNSCRKVTVYQLAHNGACWEHIPGANWSVGIPCDQTVAETLLAHGAWGEWPDDDDERVCFHVVDEDGEYMLDTDGDKRFVFTAGELRRGKLDE